MRRKYYGNLHKKFRLAKIFRRQMTLSENLIWFRIRGNKLLGLHFRRQHVLRGYIVDFFCHEAKLIIEIDGQIHHGRGENDRARDTVLASDGFSILLLSAEAVERDPDLAVRIIEKECRKVIG
ncbi:MAG: DUF559 domain-containing protein [Anaerolineales bacterium]|nr:DUF559 domain-containing protein [Anaerolineales bacterium]